jgi:hypothetical protein
MKIELQEEISDRLYEGASHLPGYSIYHTRAWHELLADVFGWRVKAVVRWGEGDRLVGFLPFLTKRRFLVKSAICLPLSHSVGPIVDSEQAVAADDLCRLVGSIEVHAKVPGSSAPQDHAHVETIARFDGSRDPEKFRSRLKDNVRRNLRAAQKFDVTLDEGANADLFAAYAELQSLTRRRQGSPDYPRGFFPAMGRLLGAAGLARVHLTLLNGELAAGTVSLNDPDGATYYYGYGGSRQEAEVLQKRVNQVAMWAAISHACRAGAERFSFGSSPLHQEDLWRYKERFGGETLPLVWTMYGRSNSAISENGLLARVGSRVLQATPMPVFRAFSPLLLRQVV